jgi:hypothetical protein
MLRAAGQQNRTRKSSAKDCHVQSSTRAGEVTSNDIEPVPDVVQVVDTLGREVACSLTDRHMSNVA